MPPTAAFGQPIDTTTVNTTNNTVLLSSRNAAAREWKASRLVKKQNVEKMRRIFFALAFLLMIAILGIAVSVTSNPFERAQIAQRGELVQHAVLAETEEMSSAGSMVGVVLPAIN